MRYVRLSLGRAARSDPATRLFALLGYQRGTSLLLVLTTDYPRHLSSLFLRTGRVLSSSYLLHRSRSTPQVKLC